MGSTHLELTQQARMLRKAEDLIINLKLHPTTALLRATT